VTAEDIKRILNLQPHPTEGGWYVRTYESGERIPSTAFADARYPGPRFTATAIYYLLEPDTFSELHRLRSDELFHFYAGDAVEMLQLHPGGEARIVHIGSDLAAGQRPQVLAPRNVWQGSRLLPGGRWALLGCTVAPGFEFDDYEAGNRALLTAAWPEQAERIGALTYS
jgi:predicted cupin superfamily sugar epimerase